MKSIVIIRIEHNNGIGMFRAGDVEGHSRDDIYYFAPDLVDRFKHSAFPTPFKDNLDIWLNNKKWYCAFKSLDDMINWVTETELIVMSNHNYKVLQLEVEEYQIGDFQVLYTKESIKKSIDITNDLLKTKALN